MCLEFTDMSIDDRSEARRGSWYQNLLETCKTRAKHEKADILEEPKAESIRGYLPIEGQR